MRRHGRPVDVRNWQEQPLSVVLRGRTVSNRLHGSPMSASCAAASRFLPDGSCDEQGPPVAGACQVTGPQLEPGSSQ